jgi:hypothetical protein
MKLISQYFIFLQLFVVTTVVDFSPHNSAGVSHVSLGSPTLPGAVTLPAQQQRLMQRMQQANLNTIQSIVR